MMQGGVQLLSQNLSAMELFLAKKDTFRFKEEILLPSNCGRHFQLHLQRNKLEKRFRVADAAFNPFMQRDGCFHALHLFSIGIAEGVIPFSRQIEAEGIRPEDTFELSAGVDQLTVILADNLSDGFLSACSTHLFYN